MERGSEQPTLCGSFQPPLPTPNTATNAGVKPSMPVHRRRSPSPTMDIHRKPGYDLIELFLDPQLRLPALGIAWRLFKNRLGLRTLMT